MDSIFEERRPRAGTTMFEFRSGDGQKYFINNKIYTATCLCDAGFPAASIILRSIAPQYAASCRKVKNELLILGEIFSDWSEEIYRQPVLITLKFQAQFMNGI